MSHAVDMGVKLGCVPGSPAPYPGDRDWMSVVCAGQCGGRQL
jgi:hypothetical protein